MSAARRSQNYWVLWVTTMVLACLGNAVAQSHYQVVDLGTPKNDAYSMVMAVNNEGWTEIMAGNIGGAGGIAYSGHWKTDAPCWARTDSCSTWARSEDRTVG